MQRIKTITLHLDIIAESKIDQVLGINWGLYGHKVIRIRRGQTAFIGHKVRMEDLEHLITMGKLAGRRGRGPRYNYSFCFSIF